MDKASPMSKPIYADIQYLAEFDGPAVHYVYPPSTGEATRRPPNVGVSMPVHDARHNMTDYTLDTHGFKFASHQSEFAEQGIDEFHEHPDNVRSAYYAECTELVMQHTGASQVIAFDHNLRSKKRADSGYTNMNEPVRFCHNDYTHDSGPRRLKALLPGNNEKPISQRYAFINVWRPLMEPVMDKPLALCVSDHLDGGDLIPTEIRHFKDEDLSTPAHRGEVYSIRHNANHKWVYLSEMRRDEIVLLKCFDSMQDGRARFTPHTAIDLPTLTEQTPPRESVEVRLVAFFD